MTEVTGDGRRILLADESWNTYAVHTKGSSSYTTSSYEEGAEQLIREIEACGHKVTFMPNHSAVEESPFTADELAMRFDIVILSDLPSDSLSLPRAVFVDGERRPNRLISVAQCV